MLNFIRSTLRTSWNVISWLRVAILNLIFLVLVIIIFGALSPQQAIEIPNKSALVIAPSGILVDQSSYNPTILDALGATGEQPSETLVRDIVNAIHIARDDDQITGIILRLDYLQQGGMSKIEEIGQALRYFQESNKPVIAYADAFTQQSYFLASYADEIYVNPMGSLYITGFGVFRNYYKNASDKLALKFHVFRVGEFKDAVEPFIRDNMSDASREHISAWLNNLWQRYTESIENRRKLDSGTVETYISRLHSDVASFEGDSAQLALESGLVDGILSRTKIKDKLIEMFGSVDDGKTVDALGMHAYLNNPTLPKPEASENKIGLIVAAGTIYDGHQPEGSIGSETLGALIRQARNDDSLNALVLRVDSGGGSAFASEVIREELALTREQGLPIYISMGSVAASGGYWIATPADEIWATPTTLTGSIGVFGLIPNFSGTMEKIGVSSDGVATSPLADAFNFEREMSPEAKIVIQSSVENIYKRFITLVATSREQTREDIHNIAQGRVWFGEKALELGLVDNLGSLQDVFTAAAHQQNLDNYEIKVVTRELSPKEQFIRAIMEQSESSTGSPSTALTLESKQSFTLLNRLAKQLHIDQDSFVFDAEPLRPLSAWAKCIECQSAP